MEGGKALGEGHHLLAVGGSDGGEKVQLFNLDSQPRKADVRHLLNTYSCGALDAVSVVSVNTEFPALSTRLQTQGSGGYSPPSLLF